MGKVALCLFVACLAQVSMQALVAKNKYHALVVEYDPSPSTDRNIMEYEWIIQAAAQNYSGDILVFPEKTLSVDAGSVSMIPRGEDKVVPYKNETYAKYKVLTSMSKAAAENKIYVVVNLREVEFCTADHENCPANGKHLYNTNVVFDRTGAVIARYRKYNIYDEPGAPHPKPEAITFKTDFGVTFGTFICFDVLFQTPTLDLVQKLKIKDFIFPSYWYSELPFLTSLQIQSGWSYANNVNLLASGANKPSTGTGGSGIYHGRTKKQAFMGERPESLIIRNDVVGMKTIRKNGNREEDARGMVFLQDPSIRNASFKVLDPKRTRFQESVTSGSLVCKFDVTYKKNPDADPRMTYRAVAFQGDRPFGKTHRAKVEYCAMVVCIDGNCARKPENGRLPFLLEEVKVEAEFAGLEGSSFQMPTTLVWDPKNGGSTLFDTVDYANFEYETEVVGKNTKVKMRTTKAMGNVMTFGIFGRRFD